MSKVPYTVNVQEYVCTALDYIRKMHETRDYSGLIATVERIQYHANNMEDSIRETFEAKYWVRRNIDNEDITDSEFRAKLKTKIKLETDYD